MLGSSEHHPPGGIPRAASPPSRSRGEAPRWLQRTALAMSAVFVWSAVLALPAQALAHPAPPDHSGRRRLTPEQMRQMVGQQTPVAHAVSVADAPGGTYPWEGSVGDANTGNGNKQTSLPIVGWTQRGGLPVSLALTHNSESNRNAELGQKWSHSYDIYLMSSGGTGGERVEAGQAVSRRNPVSLPTRAAGGRVAAARSHRGAASWHTGGMISPTPSPITAATSLLPQQAFTTAWSTT